MNNTVPFPDTMIGQRISLYTLTGVFTGTFTGSDTTGGFSTVHLSNAFICPASTQPDQSQIMNIGDTFVFVSQIVAASPAVFSRDE